MTTLPQLAAGVPQATRLRLDRIVLIGFMGAGKSTIGHLLAEALDWRFADLDARLEERSAASIPELFALHGEPHFRHLESRALASTLAEHHVVLALGGGTPEVLTNRLLIEQTPGTFPIFLEAPFETVYDRCILQGLDRPLLADLHRARARFIQRQPSYRRLARLTLRTDGRTPRETTADLLQALEKDGLFVP